MKNNLWLFVFCSFLIFVPRALAFDAVATDATASPGQQVNIQLNFSGNTKEIVAVDMRLEYDPTALQVTSIDKGTAVANLSLVTNTSNPGFIKAALSGTSSFTVSNGNLLVLHLTVRSMAKSGKYTVHLAQVDFSTMDTIESADVKKDGTLTVTAPDTTPPTAPTNLTAVNVSTNSTPSYWIRWNASTDNSGAIARYDIYRNGTLISSTTAAQLSYQAGSPKGLASFNFYVKAVDAAGNVSLPSNTVIVKALPVAL